MKTRNRTFLTLAVVAVLAIFTAPEAEAAVLFGDTFDRANSSDLNASATGQSGTLGTLNWVEVVSGGNPAIDSNQMRFGESGGGGGGWTIAYVDHNFTDAPISTGGEFAVSVDLVGPVASNGGTRFTGFAVGNSKAEMDGWSSNNPTTTFTSDFFFGYDTTGTNEVKVFINGTTQDYQQGINLDSGGALSVNFSSITDFNSGSTVNYEAFINGSSVKTGSFIWSGTNENYMALYSNYTSNQGLVDNFEVTAIGGGPPPPPPVATEFVAYHDLGGVASPGNITTQTSLGATVDLINFADGTDTGVNFSISGANGIDVRTGTITRPPAAGTPAGDLFLASGIDLDDGMVYEGGNNGSGSTTFTFSDMDPNFLYDVALYGDRNASQDGVERFTLSGVDEATNISSTGIISDLITDMQTRPNAPAGDLVRWTDIAPGADGIFTIDIDPEFTSASNIAYLTAVRLEAIAVASVPEPSTFALAALGLLGLGWFSRRRKR